MKERRMTMKQSWFCFKHLSFSSTYLQSTGKNTIQKQPPEVFIKKGVLKNFAKFRGKHQCQSLFFNKAAGLRPATLLKKRLLHRCFTVNFAKCVRSPFLQNTSGRLLLTIPFRCRDAKHLLSQLL